METATLAIIPVATLLLVVVLLFKLRVLDEDALLYAAMGAGALVLIAFCAGLWWSIPTVLAARALDAKAGLADRLGSAWDFEHLPVAERTPFMEAAIRDAARSAEALRVRRFIRFTRPQDLPLAAVMILAVGALLLLRFPPPIDELALRLPPRPPPPPPPMVAPFQALLAQQKVEESRKEAEKLGDPEAKKVLQKLDDLWKGISARKFDKRELWRRIAALQKQKDGELSEEDKAELGKLRKQGQALAKTGITQKLGQALQKGDLQKAQEALRELSKRLKDKSLTKKERSELEKALKQAAKQTKKELENLRRKLEKLQKQQQKRSLQKLSKEKNQRELQRLSKELEKLQNQLANQLSQELLDALKKMKKYEDGDAGQSLEKGAEKLREMMKRLRKLQLQSKTQDHIREMKELLRRGNQQKRDQQMQDFMVRAGNGQGDLTLPLPGDGEGQQGQGGRQLKPKPGGGNQPGDGQGQGKQLGQKGGQGGEGKGQGPGIGTGQGDREGKSTEIDAKYVDVQLKGKKGRGESTSEVFMGAAQKGFSRTAYKNVYQKYKEVVEEAMEKNKAIPPGQKRLVEKYFEMIRPK